MALSKSALKAKFVTGAIPTQTDFANLIDKIPVGGGSNKDTTLTTFDTENPYVRGYRFIVLDDSLTYLIFGLYNDTERVILPYIVIKCHTANPIEQSESIPVTYAILTGNQMMDWYIAMNAQLHEVDDATLINNMPSDLVWNPINSNMNVRVVVDGNSTFILHPVKQKNNWYVGYAIEQVVNIDQDNAVYSYHPNNNSPTIWNNDDSTIIADLRNTSKFNKNPFKKDNFNHNILNICTNISGTFSTFVFNLADINIEGNSKTLPIELMVIIDDNTRFTVDGPYYIKNNIDKDLFSIDWNALISLLDKSYGTITTTNNMVVTRCNNIKNNYMKKY